MDGSALSNVLSRRFRLPAAPSLVTPSPGLAIAFSRLRSEVPNRGRSGRVPPEGAFTIQLPLAGLRSWRSVRRGREQPLPCAPPGGVFLFDLSEDPRLDIDDPFDLVRFYISNTTIDYLAAEHGHRRIGGLLATEPGYHDPFLHGLGLSLAAQLERPQDVPPMLVEHISLAFYAHVTHIYGGRSVTRHERGRLTPGQLRRVCDLMLADLGHKHTIADLARDCALSSGHFAKAFKETTGLPPHQWLLLRRTELARNLLARTTLSLSEIAILCGFSDQSHFSRVFSRTVQQSPSLWRRVARD